jgi:hypothetical protein
MSASGGVAVAVTAPLLAVAAIAFLYAGYWGLAIRRGLHAKPYRNQALDASLTALSVVVILAVNLLLPAPAGSSGALFLLNAVVDLSLLVLLLYWVNTTESIARKSDPYERDTLRYSTAKYPWLAFIALPILVSLAYNPAIVLYTAPANLDLTSSILGLAPWAIAVSFGSVLMFLSASRSRDRTLTGHIRWFAVALAATAAVFADNTVWRATGGDSSPYLLPLDLFFFGGLFAAAYCFYRSAKSLAPTTKTL